LLVKNPAPVWAGGQVASLLKVCRFFTKAELTYLLQTALVKIPHHYALLLLMARTGLRLGEALALQVGDIDLSAACLYVRRTWGSRRAQGDARFKSPKGGKVRRVDMSRQLGQTMHQFMDNRVPVAWLWPTTTDSPMHPMGFYKDVWRPGMQASGLPYRKPHTLRHTYASLLIAQGASLAYVKEQLGHASIKMNVDTMAISCLVCSVG
jgi:integrase